MYGLPPLDAPPLSGQPDANRLQAPDSHGLDLEQARGCSHGMVVANRLETEGCQTDVRGCCWMALPTRVRANAARSGADSRRPIEDDCHGEMWIDRQVGTAVATTKGWLGVAMEARLCLPEGS